MKKLLKAIEEIDETILMTDAQKRRLNRAKYVARKLSLLDEGDELTACQNISPMTISRRLHND